jgi:crotonobetainyl-CoA:carnitine CoA-transferase CaiB-like acyl-CoA transferase
MDYPSLLAHPRIAVIAEIDHPVAGRFKTVRPVARFSATPNAISAAPVPLGQRYRGGPARGGTKTVVT